jgi:hypothetical protein
LCDECRTDVGKNFTTSGTTVNDFGWLFGGKADLIAFETTQAFVNFQTTILQEIADKHVCSTEKALSFDQTKYNVSSREGVGKRGKRITCILSVWNSQKKFLH